MQDCTVGLQRLKKKGNKLKLHTKHTNITIELNNWRSSNSHLLVSKFLLALSEITLLWSNSLSFAEAHSILEAGMTSSRTGNCLPCWSLSSHCNDQTDFESLGKIPHHSQNAQCILQDVGAPKEQMCFFSQLIRHGSLS